MPDQIDGYAAKNRLTIGLNKNMIPKKFIV